MNYSPTNPLFVGILIFYTLSLFFISLVPVNPQYQPAEFPSLDKVAHFIEYLILTCLWYLTISHWAAFASLWFQGNSLKYVILLICYPLAIAITVELLQGLTSTRSFSIFDLLADFSEYCHK